MEAEMNTTPDFQIQWYPGHMAKTKKLITESMKVVDVVIELLDARIPLSSKNPDIDGLAEGKKKIVLLNKADLADRNVNSMWREFFEKQGSGVILSDSKKGTGLQGIVSSAAAMTEEKRRRQIQRGRLNVPVRAMVVGVPNVGKSTLINSVAGRNAAKAADKPGVTRGKQWIKVKGGIELLDMPGILWPKLGDPEVGLNLCLTGAIRDEIVSFEKLAGLLIQKLSDLYPEAVNNRYDVQISEMTPEEAIEAVGKKRGYILKGQKIDTARTAVCIIDEFRGGKLGKISLEQPKESVGFTEKE